MDEGTHQDRAHDGALIRRSMDEPECFGLLFDRHYAPIHRFIQRRIGPEIADELAAETFTRAFDSRARFDCAQQDARPWLFGIATNLLRMHARTEGRRLRAYARASEDPLEDFAGAAIDRASADLQKEKLLHALSKLAKRDREVVLLYAWADLGLVEIAAALEIPEGTARSRLSRARKQLSKSLGGTDADSLPLVREQESQS
jgi:RNA polymerase sigma-70 factor (ECF subfamily)